MEQNQDNKMIYRRFELLKPDQEEDLQNLVAEKNLTREDLILICSTLSLKKEPEHTANVNGHRLSKEELAFTIAAVQLSPNLFNTLNYSADELKKIDVEQLAKSLEKALIKHFL